MTEHTGDLPQKRILILCVDRDGDLGVKANVHTPLIGRAANLDGAVALALRDAEEPDANAMFDAVSLHDNLVKEQKPDEVFEIATICGSGRGGVGADRKIVAELAGVLEKFGASEVILVTDGYTDEAVLPLIESRVPVSSVRRIVVKHSESIEETAQVMSKYMRMLVEDPKYSRIALGVPGVLFLLWVVSMLMGWTSYLPIAVFGVLSAVLLIKGFGVDRTAKKAYRWAREYNPPALPVQIATYTTIAGILCVAVSFYSGYINTLGQVDPLPVDVGGWLGVLPLLSVYFIKGALDLITVGLCTVLVGRSIHWYFSHDVRLLRNVAFIVMVAWFRVIFDSAADVLISPGMGYWNLIFYIVVGILIAVASSLVVLIVQRSAKEFFSKSPQKNGDFDES